MSSDRKPPKRARSHMGDEERATQPRLSHTSPYGVPVYADPELTPAPMEPPPPNALPGYGTLPAPIREQFDSTNEHMRELTRGLQRVWDLRHDSERIKSLEQHMQTVRADSAAHSEAIDEVVKPTLREIMTKLNFLVSAYEHNRGRQELFWEEQWPAARRSLDGLHERMARIERVQDRQESELKSLAQTIENSIDSLHSKVSVIEQANLTRDIRLGALERRFADEDAGDKRELALTTKQRAARAALFGIVATVGGAIGQLLSWLFR